MVLNGHHLARYIVMTAVALECRFLMGIFGAISEPKRILKTKSLTHPRALCDQPVIKRSGLLQTTFWQGFIREGHHETAFVILG